MTQIINPSSLLASGDAARAHFGAANGCPLGKPPHAKAGDHVGF